MREPHAGKLVWNPAVFGYQMETSDDTTFDERDSAPFVPKCVIVDESYDWKGEPGRRTAAWNDIIFYEAHVKGFTKLNPAVPEPLRGTYAGLGHKSEPHRVCRRPFRLSHAATAGSSSIA
jgi:isoamylase